MGPATTVSMVYFWRESISLESRLDYKADRTVLMMMHPKNYLLVRGAWHGAWCWERELRHLSRSGHNVFAIDLLNNSNNEQVRMADFSAALLAFVDIG